MSTNNEDVLLCHDVRRYLIDREFSGVAHYSVIDAENEIVELTNTACIADLLSLHYKVGDGECSDPRLNVYYLPTYKGEGEWWEVNPKRIRFTEYLYKRSFLKDVFVLTEHFNPALNGTLVSRCDVSNKRFGLANNILRIGIENREHLDSWVTLVDAGVNEDLAFLMCEYIRTTVKGGLVAFKGQERWYHSVMTRNSRTVFANILKGRNKLESDTFTEDPTYEVLDDLCGGQSVLTMIRDSLCYHEVETEAVLDLMGDISEPASVVDGFTINELNKFWEEY